METPRPGGIRFALRKNNRIAYDPGRPLPEPAHAPVLLLHDLLSDRSVFSPLAGRLRSAARVLMPDARGHGASATLVNQRYSVAELARDAAAVLDAEQIARVHVVGHGLGGATALELALREPGRVASLILIEPACHSLLDSDADPYAIHLREERRASDRAAADAAYKGLIDRALDAYLTPRHGPGWRDEASRRRLSAIRRHAGALAGLLPALDGYAPTERDLAKVTVPVALAAGVDASRIDTLVIDRLAAALPATERIALTFEGRLGEIFTGDAATALERRLRAGLGSDR